MEQVNFENVFADLVHSFESAADKIKKITDELEDEVYMRIANDRKAANGFRPSYPKCKIPKTVRNVVHKPLLTARTKSTM